MTQMLLFPDPRPLVDRLGLEFFRSTPESPGVYLMRDANDAVLYVGKAKNLRKRLAHYRVANPERLPRRHLRLLRAVARIELRQCPDEASALAAESELLRTLRPRFNRAGTWPGPSRFLLWRVNETGLDIAVMPHAEGGWAARGPLGARAFPLRTALVRLLWCALQPECGYAQMPLGMLRGPGTELASISCAGVNHTDLAEAHARVQGIFDEGAESFVAWVRKRTASQFHPFELAARETDLESLGQLVPVK